MSQIHSFIKIPKDPKSVSEQLDVVTQLSDLWSILIIEELSRNQVTHVCCGVGSRSTPLVLAAAKNPAIQTHVFPDERSLGFLALGIAKASGRPVAVITTSGTAVANLMPAVVEAANAAVPLILLTCDRPPELQDVAANQVIKQADMFRDFCRHSRQIPCPSLEILPGFLLSVIDRAVFESQYPSFGPVHLNIQFRDPMYRSASEGCIDTTLSGLKDVSDWMQSSKPWKFYELPQQVPHLDLVVSRLKLRKGLLVLGAIPIQAKMDLIAFAKKLNWPIIADPQSGVMLCEELPIIQAADWVLSELLDEKPEQVVIIGHHFVSQHLLRFLQQLPCLHVSDHEPSDPCSNQRIHYLGDLKKILTKLFDKLPESVENTWTTYWVKQSRSIQAKQFLDKPLPVEVGLMQNLGTVLAHNEQLMIANSMPIRLSPYFLKATHNPYIWANRGASGIDGIVSTAVGLAIGSQSPVTLIIGDMSAFYDLNAFMLLKESPYPVKVLIINNKGGDIFKGLAVSEQTDYFDRYFNVHTLDSFEHVAKMAQIDYAAFYTDQACLDQYQKWRSQTAVLELHAKGVASLLP